MKIPQISVIVPIYNAEKYLHRCIDSILGQTFTDFELLLINDGCTDNSVPICEEYAKTDSRVRIFHKENGGVSSARNLGIEHAKGEWVVFVDADDWVELDYLKCLYDGRNDGFAVSSYIYDRGGYVSYEQLQDGITVLSYNNLTDIMMKGAFMTPISKLFNIYILVKEEIRFNCNLSSCEDTLFVWTYLLYIDKIKTIDRFTYHYCITGNGLSHKRRSIEETIYFLDCSYKLLLSFKKKYKNFDIRKRHIWLVDESFKKVIVEEVCENRNYFSRKKKLCKILKSESVYFLLKDTTIVPKGIKRKIFDFLGRKKITNILTIYLYFYKYL